MNKRSILIIGDWHSDLHEESVYRSFNELGVNAFKFKWSPYFTSRNILKSIFLKFQNKYLIGPVIFKINSDLKNFVDLHRPEIIFIYRGTHIFPNTIRDIKIKHPQIKLIGYNNDDPFSRDHIKYAWRHFLKGLSYYDIIFSYRKINIDEYKSAGAHKVELLRSWYLPWVHYPVNLSKSEKSIYGCDVVFVGHHEYDDRARLLNMIASLGLKLKIYGPYSGFGNSGWKGKFENFPLLKDIGDINYVRNNEYNLAISGSKIALCFLSKLNRDTYTRRCFEIPALGIPLFSEYSDDLAELFEDGIEIVLFRNEEELKEKIIYYLNRPDELKRIGENGYKRVIKDKHDVISRMEFVLSIADNL
jgi:spore maturation protein CgeB